MKLIHFINKNFLGIILIIIALYVVITCILNHRAKKLFKRERGSNNNKYITKRCLEDGHLDYIYLIETKGVVRKFHRIVDLYSLSQLGYPRPSRKESECFSLNSESPKYVIDREIKIYNILADIREILNSRDK